MLQFFGKKLCKNHHVAMGEIANSGKEHYIRMLPEDVEHPVYRGIRFEFSLKTPAEFLPPAVAILMKPAPQFG